jgi:hypothetical protein
MAVLSNTAITYDQVGIREELSDTIYQISPEETPFMTRIGRGTVKNTHFEWQTDALASVDASNAQLEGDDAAFDAVVPTVRMGNYQQIARKAVIVSGTVEATDRAGRKNEKAYQMAKKSAELKRDIESALLSNQAAAAGSAGSARVTAGMGAFIKTNVDKAGDGTNPVYTTLPDDPRNDGTQRAFTEAMVKNVVSLAWAEGAEPRTVMVGAFNKAKFSAFAGNATKTIEQTAARPGKIIASADVYVSDFGNLTVMPNRFQRTRDAWILDFEYLSMPVLRNFRRLPIAKTGDAEKELLLIEYGLKVGSELSQGLVADLTTA